MSTWDADEALKGLVTRRAVEDVNLHDPLQVADAINNIFRENGQLAAMSIVHTALHSTNERVRLDASKYVVEKATAVTVGGEADPLNTLLSEIYSFAETKGIDVDPEQG